MTLENCRFLENQRPIRCKIELNELYNLFNFLNKFTESEIVILLKENIKGLFN